jgi:hypothetical protein
MRNFLRLSLDLHVFARQLSHFTQAKTIIINMARTGRRGMATDVEGAIER